MLSKNLRSGKKILLLGLLTLVTVGGWMMFFFMAEKNIADHIDKNDYIRLHILANSDSARDQEIKLQVKDAVVNYLTPYVKNAASSAEAGEIIMERKPDILNLTRKIMAENNAAHYPVIMETGSFDFPLKSYGALILPAGDYQAVRILLGEGRGQNWWCVLFPPLCFIDGSDPNKNPLLKKEEGQPEIKIRWKLLELFE